MNFDPALSDPSTDVDAPPEVEPPTGLLSYPAHAWRVFRARRRLKRALAELDHQLKTAVVDRDEALAMLGEATLAGPVRTAGGRITAFAETLAGLDADRGDLDRRREALTIELAALEADRRARLAEYDARLGGLDAELIPLERSMGEHIRRVEALDREAEDAADLVASLQARLQHVGKIEDPDPELIDERAAIEGRLHEISEAEGPRQRERAALDEPLARLKAHVADLTERRETVRAQRASWLSEVDTRIAETTRSRDDELDALARLDGRRRAALVDLGREALHLEGRPDQAAQTARDALDRIVSLRRERAEIQARMAQLDNRPLRRMVGAFVLIAIIAWIVAIAI